MADTFSVKAILSAKDSGFSSTLKGCSNALDSIDRKISGFSFGLLTGAGQAAFNAVTNGVSGLIGEIDSSNASWKTFGKNMAIVEKSGGKLEKSTSEVKKELQKFAQQTIYSSSDMASTYAQLAAVGTKNTTKLVKGFGGLAAAAENPQQAMKTLSQQATQMAAKPNVAWADFKLMLEQTPAGIAAVAKHMGMSASEMVAAVQDGKVKTEDFFNAIATVGGDASGEFQKMATEAKTVGQAMDGLKETVGNKVLPAFELLTQKGIGLIDKLAESFSSKFDSGKLVNKISQGLSAVEKYWNAFTSAFSGTGAEVMEAFKAIKNSFEDLTGVLGSTKSADNFKGMMESVAGFIKKIADFATEHSDKIAWLIANLPKIAIAIKGFSVAKTVAPFVGTFAGGIASIAQKVGGGLAGKLFGVGKAQEDVGKKSRTSGKAMLTSAKAFALTAVAVLAITAGFALLAFSAIQLANSGGLAIGVMAGMVLAVVGLGIGMMYLLKTLAPMSKKLMPVATAMLAMGAAVLLVSAGFAVLAFTAISLANAGGLAIGMMVGLVAMVAFLAVGAAALAPALTAGAVGLIAFGAALVLVGVGAVLAAASLAIISAILPTICAYGLQGALAIAALGGAMIIFAAGATLAGAASIVLGAGLAVAAVGIAAVGVAALVAAVGITVLSAGTLLLAASLLLTGASLALVAGILPAAASGALTASGAFTGLLAATLGLTVALIALNVPLVLIGASALVASAGMIVFGAGMLTGAAGTLAMAAGLKAVSSQMKTISKNAKSAEKSLTSMRKSVKVVESGLSALGSKAKSAMNSLRNAFDNSAKNAQSAGKKVGTNFANGMKPGLNNAKNNAKTATNSIVTTFNSGASKAKSAGSNTGKSYASGLQSGLSGARTAASSAISAVIVKLNSGYSSAYSAGAYLGMGFAQGMRSQLASIESAANRMVSAANKAIVAKAKIHSPSKLTDDLGSDYGQGWVNGILGKVKDSWNAAMELVSIPTVATPNLATAYGFELSADYDYYRNNQYVIEVPLSVDGREFARATASYTQEELNKKQTRDNRKRGRI